MLEGEKCCLEIRLRPRSTFQTYNVVDLTGDMLHSPLQSRGAVLQVTHRARRLQHPQPRRPIGQRSSNQDRGRRLRPPPQQRAQCLKLR